MILDGALSSDDLATFVDIVRDLSFEPQDLGRGLISARYRAVAEDYRIPDLLWSRIASSLPDLRSFFEGETEPPRLHPPIGEWRAVGCNPRTRVYQYGPGAQFAEHVDERWWPEPNRRSFLSVLAYIGDGCDGGETLIHGEVVAPVAGRVAIFDHRYRHTGLPVVQGTKLVVRNDIMGQPIAAE